MTLSLSIIPTNFGSIVNVYANDNNNERTEDESLADTGRAFPFIAGDWKKANKMGVVPPYGYFHCEVQEYLTKEKLKNQGYTTEHSVQFFPGLAPSGNKTNLGRTDLYYYDYNAKTAYIWEVKPGSYLRPDLLFEGNVQLGGYVNNTIREAEVDDQRRGNTYYIDDKHVAIEGALSFEDIIRACTAIDIKKLENLLELILN